MSRIASHHNEWKSLLDVSGPFLSLPVLLEVFPNGLDTVDAEITSNLKSAYEEWLAERHDVAIHSAWIDYVLGECLGYSSKLLLRGQAIPSMLSAYIPQQGLTLQPSMVLVDPSTNEPRLLIQKYDHTQKLDRPPYGEASMSCLTRMMTLLHAAQLPLGLITNGEEWVLVHAPVGETTSFISFYAHLWFSERLTLRAFFSLLKLGRFFGVPDEDTLPALFTQSAENQHEITDQLGSQVRSAVQILIQAMNKADLDANLKLLNDVSPDLLYEAAITVMMRLVFLLYAEERELLPINEGVYNEHYAISTLADQLRTESDRVGEEVLERHYDAWSRILATSRLVFGGIRHDRLNVPAYGGSLFDPDRFAFLEGRAQGTDWLQEVARPLLIDNRTVLHILENIQYLYISEYKQSQRLSFRALDIEQIGHIYEGLLEYKAVRSDAVMVGLEGTKNYPLAVISLEQIEALHNKEIDTFAKEIRQLTGKTTTSIKNSLNKEIDLAMAARLRIACQNKEDLYGRVAPFAHLLREDDYQNLVIIPKGSVYVARGSTRRATGTHYTPRSLTEPIVQHTLEPLVYEGPAEGQPEEEWELHHPARLLGLKICDMAMGSGSFLVQVIRYLSERLVESWENLAPVTDPGKSPVIHLSPRGEVLDQPSSEALPNDLDARYLLARRLVADRCIYGVDKNHLAVEMAKLSIWLITLDKERPFTFLDHALKCGDALVGVDEEDFVNWSKSMVNTVAWGLFDQETRKELDMARAKRQELESFLVRDMTDLAMKADLLKEANDASERIKLGCDLLVGARLQGLSKAEQKAEESHLLMQWMAGEVSNDSRCQTALHVSAKENAFHWFLEFPEVFKKTGFDAFVGNPPFMGGQKISGELGGYYLNYLTSIWGHSTGSTDLCAYFFLQAFRYLTKQGTFGLIATNTIAQGATRERGLAYITAQGGIIFRAENNYKWPGTAAVFINIVHMVKGNFSKYILDKEKVEIISSRLDNFPDLGEPKKLRMNEGIAYQGSIVLGMGFVLDPEEALELIEKDPKNREVLFPYLNGRDLNSRPDQSPSRWVINFFDWPLERAEQYPDCLDIVRKKVKPQRDKVKRKSNRENWWIYAENRPGLYSSIQNLMKVLVCSEVTKFLNFAFVDNDFVYSANLDVFAIDNFIMFAILQSSIHDAWARKYCSSLETRLKYSPGNGFETFPFVSNDALGIIGEKYHENRKDIMIAKQEGLTDTYNRFHNPDDQMNDILALRNLHVEMDQAVTKAYGWDDLDLGHNFHETDLGIRFTISENARREVLIRLLKLNHQRYEEELQTDKADPCKTTKTKNKSSKTKTKNNNSLLIENGQISLDMKVNLVHEKNLEHNPNPDDALSIDQLERWSWYRCAACNATVMGFSGKEHIQEFHGDVDVGFMKRNGK